MNKAFTLVPALVALTLSTTGAMAQVAHTRAHHPAAGKNRQQVNAILARQQEALRAAHAPAAKTTATSERLIANSSYNYDTAVGMPIGRIDSATFVYSGDRGSKYNKDIMSFQYPSGQYFYSRFPLTAVEYGAGHTTTGQIDQSDVLADSSTFWNSFVPDGSGGYTFGISEIVTQTRDANNRVTQSTERYDPTGTTGGAYRYINTYDASHNITSSLSLSWSAPSWDTAGRIIFTYNTAHQLVQDSSEYLSGPGMWTSDQKNTYTYNAAGDLNYSVELRNPSGTAWEEWSKTFITYNADHTVQTDSTSGYDSFTGTWLPDVTIAFGYAAGPTFWTSYTERYYDGSDMEDNIVTKHVSASGLPDSFYVAAHSTSAGVAPSYLVYGGRGTIIYNSFNDPVLSYNNNYDIIDSATGTGAYSPLPAGINHYYYEPYTTTGIKNIAAVYEAVNIYPNPATNTISIARPSAVKGSFTTVSFTNAMGQVIRTESMPWMNETETFSLAGFAPGMCIITLQNKDGGVLSTQKIIKQ